MQQVKAYYEWEFITRCIIPVFNVAGNADDWILFLDKIQNFRSMTDEINNYVDDVAFVIRGIMCKKIELFISFYNGNHSLENVQ